MSDEITLGDIFFTQFIGVFDVETSKLGLAESSSSSPDARIVCDGLVCSDITVKLLVLAGILAVSVVGCVLLMAVIRKNQSLRRRRARALIQSSYRQQADQDTEDDQLSNDE